MGIRCCVNCGGVTDEVLRRTTRSVGSKGYVGDVAQWVHFCSSCKYDVETYEFDPMKADSSIPPAAEDAVLSLLENYDALKEGLDKP